MKFRLNLVLLVLVLIFSNEAFAYINPETGECIPDGFDQCLTDANNPSTNQSTGNTPPTTSSTNNESVAASCGYYKPAEGQTNQCCQPATKDTEFFTRIFGAGDYWCMPRILGGYCVSDLIKSTDKAFNESKVYEKIGINALFETGTLNRPCKDGIPSGEGVGCTCIDSISNMCSMYLKNSSGLSSCQTCMLNNGIYTAIGCVEFTNFGSFIFKGLLTPLLSLGGIITFLLIIYAAILILTSSGDAEKIKKAKETLTSALTGLIFIILSIFILRFIGGDLFGIFKK